MTDTGPKLSKTGAECDVRKEPGNTFNGSTGRQSMEKEKGTLRARAVAAVPSRCSLRHLSRHFSFIVQPFIPSVVDRC